MLMTILFVLMLVVAFCGLYFSKTTKEMPKSWYEWKTEFRYQYEGIVGLLHDYRNKRNDHVDLCKQPGRVAVITGGGRGIGLSAVQKLLACNMTIIMGVRDPQSTMSAVSKILDLSRTEGKLICEELDVSDLSSVKEFAKRIKTQFKKVDILINNAGIMFAPFRLTADGYESHFATNYLGHFLLTHLLLPQLRAAGKEGKNARIVNVSSCVNVIGKINYKNINGMKYYYPATAYAQSKLAQILSTRHLQRLFDEQGAAVQVNAVNPGIVDTELFEYSATTYVPLFKKIFFKTPEQGSRCLVYAAIDPSVEGRGGIYYTNCRSGTVHPVAYNIEECEKLFEYSCRILGIDEYGSGEI